MGFELWGIWHILYMLSPFVILIALYFILKNKSEKTKYIVGIVLGSISILILVARNIDIWVRSGFDHETLPLQVCHFGNIVAGLGLITKKKSLLLMAFCFNLIPAFASIIFADSLVNYTNIWSIRAQAYIWGHLFIVLCSVYGIMIYKPKFTWKNALVAFGITVVLLIAAVICNPLFRTQFGWNANYFYIYNSNGVPFQFIYNWGTMATYGWFSINWVYAICLIVLFSALFVGLYWLAKLITRDKCKKQKNKQIIKQPTN